jgi:hypothetical protein
MAEPFRASESDDLEPRFRIEFPDAVTTFVLPQWANSPE